MPNPWRRWTGASRLPTNWQVSDRPKRRINLQKLVLGNDEGLLAGNVPATVSLVQSTHEGADFEIGSPKPVRKPKKKK